MCLCMYMPMCCGELVRSEGSFVELILSYHLYLSSGDGIQVYRFVSRCFCLLNCLTGFFLIIFTCSLVLHAFTVSCDHHCHPLFRLFHFPKLHIAQLSISPLPAPDLCHSTFCGPGYTGASHECNQQYFPFVTALFYLAQCLQIYPYCSMCQNFFLIKYLSTSQDIYL